MESNIRGHFPRTAPPCDEGAFLPVESHAFAYRSGQFLLSCRHRQLVRFIGEAQRLLEVTCCGMSGSQQIQDERGRGRILPEEAWLRGSRSAPLKLKEISQELSQCRSRHGDHHVFVGEHGAVPSNRTECVFSRLPKGHLSHPSATRRLLRKH